MVAERLSIREKESFKNALYGPTMANYMVSVVVMAASSGSNLMVPGACQEYRECRDQSWMIFARLRRRV
jgi:hypothetical protein